MTTYYIAHAGLGKPGTKLGKPYTDSPLWILKALKKSWITESANGAPKSAKTKTTNKPKAGRK